MLPQLYRTNLSSQLTPAQLLTLEILVWLLQVHKQANGVTIGLKAISGGNYSNLWSKKSGLDIVNKTDKTIMLPELYRTKLKNQLSQAQYKTLEILVRICWSFYRRLLET